MLSTARLQNHLAITAGSLRAVHRHYVTLGTMVKKSLLLLVTGIAVCVFAMHDGRLSEKPVLRLTKHAIIRLDPSAESPDFASMLKEASWYIKPTSAKRLDGRLLAGIMVIDPWCEASRVTTARILSADNMAHGPYDNVVGAAVDHQAFLQVIPIDVARPLDLGEVPRMSSRGGDRRHTGHGVHVVL